MKQFVQVCSHCTFYLQLYGSGPSNELNMPFKESEREKK